MAPRPASVARAGAAAPQPSGFGVPGVGRGGGVRVRQKANATNRPTAGVIGWEGGEPARNRRLGSVTEAQLIQRLKDGDQTVARTLYEAHVDRVFRICYRFAGENHLAQDFTQETFVRAFTKIGTFRGDAAFGTWIARIATTVSLNGLKKVNRFRSRETDLDDQMHTGRPSPAVEPDVRADLHRAIDGLPEGYRTVFLLHDLEGYTHKEIGKILGINVGTSKSQLFRARSRLRENLAVHAGEWAS